MRKLSKAFMDDLKTGILKSILDAIRQDQSLEFQIRENQVQIYYHGGKILDLRPKPSKGYYAIFDETYCKLKHHTEADIKGNVHLQGMPELPNHIARRGDAGAWSKGLAQLKKIMDVWFVDHPKIELKHHQLVVDHNNKLAASDKTDLFIIDIEYANKRDRFDMVAMSWPTDTPDDDPSLLFIEFKVGDNALRSASSKTGTTLKRIPGITEHFRDFAKFITPANYASVKEEMLAVLKQKVELDVLCHNEKQSRIATLEKFSDAKPLFLFVFANHSPKSGTLLDEMQKIEESDYCDLKCALVKYKKYGLLNKSMRNLEDAKAEVSRRLNA